MVDAGHGKLATNSASARECIEQCFGWGKTIGPIRQVMVQELDRVDQLLTLTMAAYTIVDATIIAAPSSTKNEGKARDPEMHQTKKGNQ